MTQSRRAGNQVSEMLDERPPAPARHTFLEVYERHFDRVWSALRALGLREAELDDAVQSVFLVVHRRLDEFAGRASIDTWLFAIAMRVAAKQRRGHARHLRRVEALGREAPDDDAEDPELALIRAEARAELHRFRDGLPASLRVVFEGWFVEGRPASELAESLGLSRHTISSRVRLIRERFDVLSRRLAARDAGGTDAVQRDRSRDRVRALWIATPRSPATWQAALSFGMSAVVTIGVAVGVTRRSESPAPIVAERGDPTPHAIASGVAVAALPSVRPAPSSPIPTTPTAPPPPARPRARPIAAAAPTAGEVRPPSIERSAPDLAAAIAHIEAIRADVKAARFTAARDRLAVYSREFPADPFAREREAYAAIVSCRADRETGDAAAFLLRNGGTALATQVEAACATTSTDAILGARGPTPR